MSVTAEQALARVSITLQHHLVRERQYYGPLCGTSRASPRALQPGSVLLQLDDDNPPLAPSSVPPLGERTFMGNHYDEIMKELNARNDEVAFLSAQKSDRDVVIQNAECHIRSAEAALHHESQQRDVAISMAREVATGQSAVLLQVEHQAECRVMEQAAQASRMSTMYADAERQIIALENMVRESKAKTEESSQLLSGSVSAVYALEGETYRLQQTVIAYREEATQLKRRTMS